MKMKKHVLPCLTVAAIFVCGAMPVRAASSSPANKRVAIRIRSQHTAIDLAAAELVRYLNQMAGCSDAAAIVSDDSTASPAIEVGLASEMGIAIEGLADPSRDDAIHIDVRNSQGVIAGSNPRSVLFAAYRFLEASGCRWIRPGKDGDYVPFRSVKDLSVQVSDKAFYRIRGNNNCGAQSLDHLLDKIAWAPKVGLNTFFHEFFLPRGLFNNYYNRQYPSLRATEPRSDEEVRAYHELSVREIKRRGMFYHAAGHGWTSLVLGLPESESDHWARPAMPQGKEWMVALYNGQRDLSRGPTFTDLCYGNPEVRRLLVQCVADYAQQHPEVDYLHVWTDDAMNRTCECPLCCDTRISDFYVEILNGIDAEFSCRDIPTRIVFLIYQDLLWPPEKQRIKNPDRFTQMFAPISRKYDKPYDLTASADGLPPYQLNQNKQPSDEHASMTVLRSWQKVFSGETFVFDYHMVWHHYYDPGYVGFTDVLAEDIRRLPQMGVQGFVSCQNIRVAFPHSYPVHLHARLLWNPKADTDALFADYFVGAFGDGAEQAGQYVTKLSSLFEPLYLDRTALFRKEEDKTAALAKLAEVSGVVTNFRPVIEQHLSVGSPTHCLSWKYLSLHTGLAVKIAEALQAKVGGSQKEANAIWTQAIQQVAEDEVHTDPVLDLYYFNSTYNRLFKPAKPVRRTQL